MDSTRTIRSTDYDALSCRFHCLSKTYLECPHLVEYIASLERALPFEHQHTARRTFNHIVKSNKLPIINIGTYIRTIAIDRTIASFLTKFPQGRVMSIGAGSDTRCFSTLERWPGVEYVEVDFAQSTRLKHAVIATSETLSSIVGVECVQGSPGWYSSLSDGVDTQRYKLMPLDLADLDQLRRVLHTMDENKPTLVISEAMLCYVEATTSNAIIQVFREHFTRGSILIYDPIGGTGSFGQVMVENLKMRNLTMPSLLEFNTLEKYKQRLNSLGVRDVVMDDTYSIYNNWIAQDEKLRISKLEFLDEIEELRLLLEHYCVVLGWWGFGWDDLGLPFTH